MSEGSENGEKINSLNKRAPMDIGALLANYFLPHDFFMCHYFAQRATTNIFGGRKESKWEIGDQQRF
ncbi:MAG: hypothetical protein QGI16_04350 [Candidatus Marinimicrobia bacterium]|jgi:hypothetical protein|nr:hypothetical protein [Candidatus Neomarinimicrobiota bacterium]|tara:strand:- start:144 stop:344 length:201 start_codon:yes stop_codon:yes gene_type:complete